MQHYRSPGVYVEEVPSAVQPIAGVGTSTAGFIGVFDTSANPSKGLIVPGDKQYDVIIGVGDGANKKFPLEQYPVDDTDGSFEVRIDDTVVAAIDVKVVNDDVNKQSRIEFEVAAAAPPAPTSTEPNQITADYQPIAIPVDDGVVKLCTNFGDFKKFFGGFSNTLGQKILAHAVFGFFQNGGTRCYVVYETVDTTIASSALKKFEAIDEIALVAAPGITGDAVWSAIVAHCSQATKDRFGIFDSDEIVETSNKLDTGILDPSSPTYNGNMLPDNSNYAAFYFPWIQVFDPATKFEDPNSDGYIYLPPSGHIAGVYARVDTNRGVHKAPANETVLGALGLKYYLSRSHQDGLNPHGVNCIRDLNGNIRVWGARTIGGNANGEWKYINVRRLFLFLRESIDEGTQWTVFEPNSPDLWSKISRNITAFLTNVWRSGALFGNTPAEAFYVKCDAETNPPEVRELGQVVTEIGVAVVKPAEFVIFRISQWAGPGQ